MFHIISFFILVVIAFIMDHRAKDFKESMAAYVVLIPAALGFVMSCVVEIAKYFLT